MIFEPKVWDIVIVVIAGYLAIVSLARMMRVYRRELVTSMRAMILERRAAQSAARKAKRAMQQKVEEENVTETTT